MHTTILVTGATGTVGREVIKQLSMLAGDIRIRAGVHSVITGENLKRLPGVEISEMDFENPESLRAAFTHADKLFMVAPFAEDQVAMEKALVNEAKRAGVKHIVKLSTMGADKEPGMLLGRWHHEIERHIEGSGISYTFIRPTSFMQNFIAYNAPSIKQEGKFYQPLGTGKVGYIDARDIAAVGVEALLGEGHAGKVYELTGPEALSNQEVAQQMSEVLGKPVAYVDVPEAEARRAMIDEGTPSWMADALLELYAVYKSGGASQTTDTVEKLTGQKPHTMRQFLQDHREDFV